MTTLKFTLDDLEANRKGFLSEAQKETLDPFEKLMERRSKASIQRNRRFKQFAAFAIGVLVLSRTVEFLQSLSTLNHALFLLDTLVRLAVCGAMALWLWHSSPPPLVTKIVGTAHLDTQNVEIEGKMEMLYCVEIRANEQSSRIFHFQNAEAQAYFAEGSRCQVYYLSYADIARSLTKALSVERV